MRQKLVRVVAGAAFAAAVVGGASGCSLRDGEERVVSYGVSEPVRTLVIEGHTGGVTITGGAPAVKVTERQNYRGEPPATTHVASDGTLTLTYSCENCGVGYDVEVPTGTAVRVRSEVGGVQLAGLDADVQVRAGTGGVHATALRSPTVKLAAETGGISAGFAESPTAVDARTATGGVRISVPAGTSYAVEAGAGTGGVTVEVPRDPAARRTIAARTETGGVEVVHG
ncbi:hypothetical protein [Kitasatospora sp. NPDC050543]|uniref:hypothetical protein n=1 Tax=Kitasatospora sp. NPDC050543 TaxID=3364054 RepID=UPI0037B2A0CE